VGGRGGRREGKKDPMTLATDLRLWGERAKKGGKEKGGEGGKGHPYFFFFYNSITDGTAYRAMTVRLYVGSTSRFLNGGATYAALSQININLL
jgi:hypothetical protein